MFFQSVYTNMNSRILILNFCKNRRLTQIFRSSYTNVEQYLNQPPKPIPKLVGKWLLVCGGLVFGTVTLGGATRLTESGLSMVTWKFLGERVPRTPLEWDQEFDRYKLYPEYKLKNSTMTLSEFKSIYFMEYLHRMYGRIIGVVFLVPAMYFWKKGYLSTSLKRRILLIGGLIGTQGFMGWYMVKSGLENRFQDANDTPRVSQYRLASHLAIAFIIYSLFVTTGLSTLQAKPESVLSNQGTYFLRLLSRATKLSVFLTAVSGAFVAGLDAGLVYNSFPKMGDNWIPSEFLSLKPMLRNFTENPVTVQFDHRVLGQVTVGITTLFWIISRRTLLLPQTRQIINFTAAMAWIQAALGVSTLLNYVPLPLAIAHQSGSLIFLTLASWSCHELRIIRYIPK